MIRNFFLLLLVLSLGTNIVSSQDITKQVVSAFEKGDAKKLSSYLNDNLEIKLLETKQMVSRNQATRILQEFFNEHPPKSFKITYEGTKQGTEYEIGEYKSNGTMYRVNLYFIKTEKEKLIYYLTIEKV